MVVFNLFCNVWVCMCGSSGIMCICIYCVLYCLYCAILYCFVYVYLLFVLFVLVYGLLPPSGNSIAVSSSSSSSSSSNNNNSGVCVPLNNDHINIFLHFVVCLTTGP